MIVEHVHSVHFRSLSVEFAKLYYKMCTNQHLLKLQYPQIAEHEHSVQF